MVRKRGPIGASDDERAALGYGAGAVRKPVSAKQRIDQMANALRVFLKKLVGWAIALGIIFAVVAIGTAVSPYIEDYLFNQRTGDPDLKVWVNPDARVYYDPSSAEYGHTEPGYYTSQAIARAMASRAPQLGGGDMELTRGRASRFRTSPRLTAP